LTLGGGGYIVYKKYFFKPKPSDLPPPMITNQNVNQTGPINMQPSVDEKMTELQKQKLAQKRVEKTEQRKAVFRGFDNEINKFDDISKIPQKEEEFIHIEDIKNNKTQNTKPDVFSKLAAIANKKEEVPEKPAETPIDNMTHKEAPKVQEKKEQIQETPANKKSHKLSPKKGKKKEVFEKLEGISAKYSKEEMLQKIATISRKSTSKVSTMLDYGSLSSKQATSLFDNLGKSELTSDVFKEILFNLIASGKLSKETVSSMLFEYMDQQLISKKDVAKIMSDLKLI
jgi:hypothetical protein